MPPIIFPFRLHKCYVTNDSVQCVVCGCYRPSRTFSVIIFCGPWFVSEACRTQSTLNFNSCDEKESNMCYGSNRLQREGVFLKNQFMFFYFLLFIYLFIFRFFFVTFHYFGFEVRSVFLDISKAFDNVWHEGIIFKLKQKSISDDLLNILSDFLRIRKQRVTLNGQSSSCTNVNAGVPEGSILGPLLL